nr:GLPGLI family protein [uncultured Allomuricauda sp.]
MATKKYFTIGFLFMLITGGALAQEPIRITYTIEQKVNFDSINQIEVENIFMLVNEVISSFEFELLINDRGESVFRKTEPMIEDYSEIELYRLALGFSAGDEVWFIKKGNPEKLIYKNDMDNGPFLLTLDEDVKWEISKEKKLIGNYNAIKATTTRQMGSFVEKIEAWFTPALPYSSGPIGYNGLPGVILELKRDKVFYKFKELEKKSVTITPPKESNLKSFDEYYQMLESRMAEIKSRDY